MDGDALRADEVTLRPRAFELGGGADAPDVPRLLRALADRRGLVALDSAAGAPARTSVVAFDPLVDVAAEGARDLAGLRALLRRFRRVGEPPALPFAGGFVGALAYDLGPAGEGLALPPARWPAPPIVGGVYGDLVALEHGVGGAVERATLVLSESALATGSVEERRARFEADLARAAAEPVETSAFGSAPRRLVEPDEHRRRVEDVRARISRGELYQANVAHALVAEGVDASDLDLYLRLREVNAAPYMGFLRFHFDDGAAGALASASPELLVEVARSGTDALAARTRPIKGTVARGRDADEDARNAAALLASEKDLAELAMIVDLERNDLGRVACPGAVRVAGFPTLQTYATVHHLVADVEADLAEGRDALDVLAALFPGGSITGAPKLASMEAIAELEGEGRGFFTGSLGFVDLDGAARFNILIRTLVRRAAGPGAPGDVTFHVGGGVTWASDAAEEDAETMHKAAGLLAALGAARGAPRAPSG